MTEDQPTCGKGIAASAALPRKLAELIATQAEILERHTRALDPNDASSKRELDVYNELAREHRDIANRLTALADRMVESRDLPMGPHDMAVMMDPNGQTEAFQRFVGIERELLDLLQSKLAEEEQMLRQL